MIVSVPILASFANNWHWGYNNQMKEWGNFWANVSRGREYYDLTKSMGVEMPGQLDPLRKMLSERREQVAAQIDDPELYLGSLPVELLDRLRDPLALIPVGLALVVTWRRMRSGS
jgi:hypothetical protein